MLADEGSSLSGDITVSSLCLSSHTAQTCVDFVIKDSIVLADLCSAPCLGLRVLSSRCTFGIFLYHDATSTPTRLKMRAKGGMRVLVM